MASSDLEIMQKPTPFTVIIPTHKRPILLRRALESIRSQTLSGACEVIVVSDAIDGATDAVCAELLATTGIYVRRNGVAGPSASRNLGLSLASGQHVLFLDDDDAWHPRLLEQLAPLLAQRPGKPVYFNCSVVTERRLPEGPQQLSEVQLDLAGHLNHAVYLKNQVHMSCFAFPRPLLDGLEFDPTMRAYEDWDYLLAVFDREFPLHVPMLGSRVFEVPDDTTDRRGSEGKANDFNAVLDYLYVYRRHPAPNDAVRAQRSELMRRNGLAVMPDLL
jgi:GalNAc5-diNAcBac-PP-undecaprenol beta-1,3-glucosyltransferase